MASDIEDAAKPQMVSYNTTINAWITPGTHINKVRITLIIKDFPIPSFNATAAGGKRIAKIINNNLFTNESDV
jgi:hypothetical protein